MKNKLTFAAFFAVLILGTATAIAGYKPPDPPLTFFEQNGSGLAVGTMAGVRSRGSATDDIGCWHEVHSDGNNSGGCKVVSGSITRSCAFDPQQFEYYGLTVNSITSHSQIYFAWNAQGTCTFLRVSADSAYSPRSVN